eukprot:scaffold318954_cov30-Prasinocladus_malaysianus.AAC.1
MTGASPCDTCEAPANRNGDLPDDPAAFAPAAPAGLRCQSRADGAASALADFVGANAIRSLRRRWHFQRSFASSVCCCALSEPCGSAKVESGCVGASVHWGRCRRRKLYECEYDCEYNSLPRLAGGRVADSLCRSCWPALQDPTG